MAKKKLFGNHKEPRCETCANGKLTADGKTVLCQRGGALPLSHSCRRYVYDPLRRVPKRRPLLGEYSAADFALDAYAEPENPIKEPTPPAAPNPSEYQTLDRVFAYLNSHDTPDTDTILAILRNWDTVEANASPDETAQVMDESAQTTDTDNDPTKATEEPIPCAEPTEATEASQEPLSTPAPTPTADLSVADEADEAITETDTTDHAVEATIEAESPAQNTTPDEDTFVPLLEPDDSPDIFGDLARLTIRDTSRFAFRAAEFEDDEDTELFLLSKDALQNEVVLTPDNSLEDDSVLSADDMVVFTADD